MFLVKFPVGMLPFFHSTTLIIHRFDLFHLVIGLAVEKKDEKEKESINFMIIKFLLS